MSAANEAETSLPLLERITVMAKAPRELWLIYLAKVFETTAYALVNYGLMLHLIEDLDFSRSGAGWFVGVFSLLFSFFTFLVGALSDAMGIRKTLVIALVVCTITRLLAALLGHPLLSPLLAFVPMTFGAALALPVMVAAARRYTSKKQQSIGFALLYVFMNAGFLIAGKLFDKIRKRIGSDEVVGLLGMELSVYQVVFLISTAFTALSLVVVLFMRRGVEMDDDTDEVVINPVETTPVGATILSTIAQALRKTGGIFKEVLGEKAFYRFLLFLGIIVLVRIVFQHMHYTLAPWADGELGYGSKFGTAWGVVNPALIIVLTPLVGLFAARVSSYRMIVVGTSICAAACFLLALPGGTFASLGPTSLGTAAKWILDLDGNLAALYFNLLFFAVAFSIGEAIWSPRLYQYTAAVAPKGREATYMGLSILPLFLGKLFAGPLGGYLLTRYSPAEGARSGGTLWLVVALMAVGTPALILLLRSIIQPKEDGLGTQKDDKTEEAPA
jgi:MFS family permease